MEALKTNPPQFKPLSELAPASPANAPKAAFKPAQVVGKVDHPVSKTVRPNKPNRNNKKHDRRQQSNKDEAKDYTKLSNSQQVQELIHLKHQLIGAKEDRKNAEAKIARAVRRLDELIASTVHSQVIPELKMIRQELTGYAAPAPQKAA